MLNICKSEDPIVVATTVRDQSTCTWEGIPFYLFSGMLLEPRVCNTNIFACDSIYAIARYMLSPVRLSVRHTGGSVKDG